MHMANLWPHKNHHYESKYPIVLLQERFEIAQFKSVHRVRADNDTRSLRYCDYQLCDLKTRKLKFYSLFDIRVIKILKSQITKYMTGLLHFSELL